MRRYAIWVRGLPLWGAVVATYAFGCLLSVLSAYVIGIVHSHGLPLRAGSFGLTPSGLPNPGYIFITPLWLTVLPGLFDRHVNNNPWMPEHETQTEPDPLADSASEH